MKNYPNFFGSLKDKLAQIVPYSPKTGKYPKHGASPTDLPGTAQPRSQLFLLKNPGSRPKDERWLQVKALILGTQHNHRVSEAFRFDIHSKL